MSNLMQYLNHVCRHDVFFGGRWYSETVPEIPKPVDHDTIIVHPVFNSNRLLKTRLHADGEDDNIRTPFGSIMEMGGVTC